MKCRARSIGRQMIIRSWSNRIPEPNPSRFRNALPPQAAALDAPGRTTGRAYCFDGLGGNLFAAEASIRRRMPKMTVTQAQRAAAEKLDDEDLALLARDRDEAAVRAITNRYNRRLLRMSRSSVRSDAQ